MASPFEAMLANVGTNFAAQLLADPDAAINALQKLGDALCPHHTGYDACQDILDAVEAGHLSHSAALQAIAILMADMERRSQKSAAPPRPEHPRSTARSHLAPPPPTATATADAIGQFLRMFA